MAAAQKVRGRRAKGDGSHEKGGKSAGKIKIFEMARHGQPLSYNQHNFIVRLCG